MRRGHYSQGIDILCSCSINTSGIIMNDNTFWRCIGTSPGNPTANRLINHLHHL
ncbi:hypothetical protein WZ342_2611 [Enterococcus faecalis]|nr:hypothetical protein WZ342_2611 [Enterococcus faecalis]